MTDRDLIDRFAVSQQLANRSELTIRAYRLYYTHFVDWLGRQEHEPTILTATREDVLGFLTTRRTAPRTRYHYISRLSVLYRWAIGEGLTDRDPTRGIDRPTRPHGYPRPITEEQLDVALAAADDRMRVWLLLGAAAGLRAQEIASVQVEDLYLDRTPPLLLVSNPKGHRERIVPVHPDLHDALVRYGVRRSGFLFPHLGIDPSQPVRPWTVSHDVAKHLRSVGVDATCHQLRHLFATLFYQESGDLLLTADQLGHVNTNDTRVYAAFDPSKAAGVVCSMFQRPKYPDARVGAGRSRPRVLRLVPPLRPEPPMVAG